MAKPGFYAVARGHNVGIYTTWDETKRQVDGFSGPRHKKFTTEREARAFLEENGVTASPSMSSPPDDDLAYLSFENLAISSDINDPILAFCAGSAPNDGNASYSGYACLIPSDGKKICSPVTEQEGTKHTNNRAAYWAALAAITEADRLDPSKMRELHVVTCNEILVKTMNELIEKWARNGWRRSRGQPVENADLLKSMLDGIGDRTVQWRHVTANSNRPSYESVWLEKARAEAGRQRLLAADSTTRLERTQDEPKPLGHVAPAP